MTLLQTREANFCSLTSFQLFESIGVSTFRRPPCRIQFFAAELTGTRIRKRLSLIRNFFCREKDAGTAISRNQEKLAKNTRSLME